MLTSWQKILMIPIMTPCKKNEIRAIAHTLHTWGHHYLDESVDSNWIIWEHEWWTLAALIGHILYLLIYGATHWSSFSQTLTISQLISYIRLMQKSLLTMELAFFSFKWSATLHFQRSLWMCCELVKSGCCLVAVRGTERLFSGFTNPQCPIVGLKHPSDESLFISHIFIFFKF